MSTPYPPVELPRPTAWPMVVALSVTLVLGGLVTNLAVSLVGIVLGLAGGIGWWREVLPVEQLEQLSLRPLAERAAPIRPSPVGVERGSRGAGAHRARVPVEAPPLSAGIRGGLIGAVAMAAVAILYGLLRQGSVWYPINLLAAVAMPTMAGADIATLRAFSATALLLGTIAHGLISILTGLLYAVILPMLPRRHMLWGGLVAPLLWTGLLSAVLGVINPALNARVDWMWFIASQIAFGLAAGLVVSRARPVATPQSASEPGR